MNRFVIFFILFYCATLTPQTAYKHTTSNLECNLVDNGIIGDDASGTYDGLKFLGGNNVIYSGGIVSVLNQPAGGFNAWGMCGSYNMADFTNSIPFTGFGSDIHFDQIGSYVYTGLGTNVLVYSFSKNDQSVIYMRHIVSNPSPNPTLPGYQGVIIDFDIGPGNNYENNGGGYDPARNLIYMFDATTGTTDTNYYGVMLLNVPPNSLHGLLIQNYSATTQDVANYLINNDFSTPPPNSDHRLHISQYGDAIPSGGESTFDFAIVCGTSLSDLLNNVDNAAIPTGSLLPVELSSFTAQADGNVVDLKWTTESELNNRGFEIQRKALESDFVTIGFVDGKGTSTEQNKYSFLDKNLNDGRYSYRLKQLDFNGTFSYSNVVDVEVISPEKYSLEQNYPNPFNPTTTIKYTIKEKNLVRISVLNSLGEEIAILINEEQDKGTHQIDFNAANLSSGIYFYRIHTGDFVNTKKMTLLK